MMLPVVENKLLMVIQQTILLKMGKHFTHRVFRYEHRQTDDWCVDLVVFQPIVDLIVGV